jgi:hypothetical protein
MMVMPRVVTEETLDHLAPQDPVAMRSRRDLVRVHRAMRTRNIVSRGWQSLVPPDRASKPLHILEIGAGDGSLLLGVARSLAPHWPHVQLTLLDRLDIVDTATLAAYADLGWTARVLKVDVLDWASQPIPLASGCGFSSPHARWDLVSAALFLHHFEGQQLDLLLYGIALRADRFFACEPRRSWKALLGSHLVGAVGANAVTREDAVLSVRAGFGADEITARWPKDGHAWRTREYPAKLFSHCFSAQRMGAE